MAELTISDFRAHLRAACSDLSVARCRWCPPFAVGVGVIESVLRSHSWKIQVIENSGMLHRAAISRYLPLSEATLITSPKIVELA